MSKNDFNETKMKRHSDERMDGRTDGQNLSSTRRQWKSKRYETNLDTTQHSQIPTHTYAAAMKFDTMRVRHLECKRRGVVVVLGQKDTGHGADQRNFHLTISVACSWAFSQNSNFGF